MDGETIDRWSIEGSFTRNYTIFGLLIIVLFCGLFLLEIWVVTLVIFLTLIFLFTQEYLLHTKIETLLSNPELTVNFKSHIFHGFISIFCGSLFFAVHLGIIHIPMFDISQVDLLHTYMRSLVVTIAYFHSFHATKQLLIGFGQVKLMHIACGCFAIIHRVIILLRFVSVTPFWISYFINQENLQTSLHFIIFSDGISITKIFIFFKVCYLSFIVWDLDCVRKSYFMLYHKLAPIPDEYDNCFVCHIEIPGKMIPLKCGHTICAKCASEKFNTSPFCPVCGVLLIHKPSLSFYDGEISFSAVFCCF